LRESRRNFLNGVLFISPWIVGFLIFTLYPVLSSLYYSLAEYNVISDPIFIGIKNYLQLFTDDNLFYTVLFNTGYMIIYGVTLTMAVTLVVAIILNNRKLKGMSFFRVVFFIPTLVPLVILSILWLWLFQPDSGLVNAILKVFHINGPGWFSSTQWSKPTFILMAIWCGGNFIIIFLAGLQEISESLYESVEIDGGNFLHKVWFIMLPMLRPVLLFNAITAMIRVFQSFAESFIITEGGPNNTTNFYSLYLYQNAFLYQKMGYASAMAWIMLVIALVITILLIKSMKWGQTE
jgi:multiple sugar transport system permease protein